MLALFFVFLLSLLALPLTALLLDWLARRFKIAGTAYRLALKLEIWRFGIVLVLALVWSLIFTDQLILTFLSYVSSIAAFFYLARLIYKIGWQKIALLFISWQLAIALAGAVAVILIRTFVFLPFYISGDSMEPALNNGDYVLIKRFDRNYQRGDIVIISEPAVPGTFLVKRIIGLPGERIAIKSSGLYRIDIKTGQGVKIDEPYLASGTKTAPGGKGIFDIPAGKYFVLGDNRKNSEDSRELGPVDRSWIIGKLWFNLDIPR